MNAVARLVLAQARAERWLLSVWILSIGMLGFVASQAVAVQFDEEPEQAAIITVAAGSPAFLFLRGAPDGTGTGAVVFFQGYAFTAVLAGLMSTFLVVRHTRTDEELGRAELLGAASPFRSAPLVATLVLGAAANLVLAVVVAAGFIAAGLPVIGSMVAGAAVGVVGLFFVAVTAAVAQFMPTGRAANGAAAALVGAAYLLRGLGDALGTASADLLQVTSAWPSLLSPIGWGQASRPFTAADPWPLLAPAAAAAVIATVVVLIRSHRDLGAALLSQRTGREQAGAGGTTLWSLAWRLQWATLLGWCLGAATLGAVAGGLGPVVTEAVDGNPSLQEVIARLVPGTRAEVIDLFLTALLGISGVLAAAAGIQTVLRLRAEEAEGRAELLLATPRTRARWLGANLTVAAASVAVVAATAGATAGLGLSLSGSGNGAPGALVGAGLAHVPAAYVFVAVTAVVFAAAPRWSVPVGWGLLAAGLVLGQFGELLGLPLWAQDLSPFRHSSALPVEAFDPAGAVALTAIALGVAGLAAYLIQRRDLTA